MIQTEAPNKMHITVKPPKITISMLASEFPWDIIPPIGTPGSKSLTIPLVMDYGTGQISLLAKVHGLQRSFAAYQEAPGGYLMFQGKLAQDGRQLLEPGSTYQVPSPKVAS